MPDTINLTQPGAKFCPMFPPIPTMGPLNKINLTFVPCLKDNCMQYDPVSGDCRLAVAVRITQPLPIKK